MIDVWPNDGNSRELGQPMGNSSNGWQETVAGQQLQQRLTNEHTLLALTRLLDRIDALEQTVSTLASAIQQGPGLISMVTDTVDETYRTAAQSGLDVENRLKGGLTILEKLTEPRTIEVFSGLLGRLDQLEQFVVMADQAPGMVSMMADTLDESYRQAAQSGVELEGRLKAGLDIAEKLTAPASMAVLSKLLDRMDQLEQFVVMADQAPGMVSMVADTLDESYRQAAQSGVELEGRLKAGLDIAEKLTAPASMAVLSKLLNHMDQLEQLVDMADQAPGIVSMVADTLDESYREAAQSGVELEGRLKAGLDIAEKLTAPASMAVLSKLLDRMDQLEQLVEMADQAPGMVSMVADTLDESYRQAAQSGVDIETRLKAGLAITEKLTAPATMEVLSDLLDRSEKLGEAVKLIDQGPGLAAMAMDTLDEAYRQALIAGIDIEALVQQGASMTAILANFMNSEELQSLQNSGMLDPKMLKVIESAGQALVTTQKTAIQPVGLFDLFRAAGDPDTQRALGFLLTFCKNFGLALQ